MLKNTVLPLVVIQPRMIFLGVVHQVRVPMEE